jgi:hypothetical protein
MPSAAAMAMRLDVFVSPPNMSISTFPDKLPNLNSRFEFTSRPVSVKLCHALDRNPPKESSEFCLYAFRLEGKLLSKRARTFLAFL